MHVHFRENYIKPEVVNLAQPFNFDILIQTNTSCTYIQLEA